MNTSVTLIFVLSAGVGAWAAYDQVAALEKLTRLVIGLVNAVDYNVGRLLDALDELGSDLADLCLVEMRKRKVKEAQGARRPVLASRGAGSH